MPQNSSFVKSLGCAINGLFYAGRNERNFKIHLAALVVAVVAALVKKISATEWVWLTIAVTSVLVAELVNTAVEKAVDLATQEQHPLARIAKDTAAAAVLLTAVQAVVIGAYIFLR